MAVRVQSGTPTMCIAMAPPDQRECVPTSSEEKPSLVAPTRRHSDMMTAMMMDALTEQRP